MEFIKSLSQLNCDDLALAGGKAASLGELTRAGFPVPSGVCVTTDAYRAFVAANGLQAEILRLSKAADAGEPQSLETASRQIQALFAAGQIPVELAAEIRSAYTQLANHQPGSGNHHLPVAVRSSATAEDLPGASFAGQQDTCLNVIGKEAVLVAVRQCWASLWTGRALGYRLREGIPPEDVSLAAIVQQLVLADVSGILFTANPVSGARGEVLINAAWGLGEAIVGGLVSPDHIVVDKATGQIKEMRIADKQVMTVRAASGTTEQPVPDAQRSAPTLSETQIAALTDMAHRIETHAGQPMDVEWALSGGQLYVLQARPITTLENTPEPPDLMDMEWSREILVERFPEPLTPFTWSVMNAMMLLSIEDTLRTLGMHLPEGIPLSRLFYSRPYINVTSLKRGLESLPFRAPIPAGRQADGSTRRSMPGPGLVLVLGRVLKIIFTTHSDWERLLPRFIAAVEQESTRAWETMSCAELLQGIIQQELLSKVMMENHARAIVAADITLQMLQGITRAWLGDQDGQLAVTLLSGLTGNKTVETNRALWRLAALTRGNEALQRGIAQVSGNDWRQQLAEIPGGVEFLASLDDFLRSFGHRSPRYDFTHPTWREKPEQVIELLRPYLDGTIKDPGAGEARKAAEREAATRSARRRLSPLKRVIFDRVLALTQIYFRLRENQQFYMMMGVPLQQRALLTLARHLREAGLLNNVKDIYFLENTEVQALAAQLAGQSLDGYPAPADPARLVAERRVEFAQNCQVNAPIQLGGKANTPASDADGALRGIPASRGIASGQACLVRGPEDFGKIQRGEILVVLATTPAWTPLFGVAGGLVTEFGGLLSHAGVVAREYGLPAVLGVPGATRLIRDGEVITVDGERGEVMLQH